MKTSLKSVNDKDWRNEELSKKLKSFLSSRINSGITSCNQSKIVEGLKKISFSMQENTEQECGEKWVLHVRPRCSQESGMDELGIPNINNLDSDSKPEDVRALH